MSKRHITLPDSLENLFIRLEEIILANSGEDEFEEIFKLVIAKLWDEINNSNLFKQDSDDLVTQRNINQLLKEANNQWSDILTNVETNLSPQHLGVCVNILGNIKLTTFGFEALDAFFEFIVSRTSKGSKGQFFTPRYVVDFCVRILSPRLNEAILDPACGSGAFLLHSFEYIKQHFSKHKDWMELTNKNLWGFDFDEKAIRVSRTLMYVAGLKKINIHKVNSLLVPNAQQSLFESKNDYSISSIEDYMRISKSNFKGFDVILTNPPFAGEITETELLNSYSISSNKVRIERDALFLERCINLLKPGGRMAIVLPNNKFGGKEWVHLREWMIQRMRIVGVVGLPQSTFMPHTSIKTSILFVEKRQKVLKKTSETIFFGISEKSGKDSRGNLDFLSAENQSWLNVNHDLKEIEEEFIKFINEEKIGGGKTWLSAQQSQHTY